MATWVEGKPIPPQQNTLSDVNNIVSEKKTPWSRVSPLSDASNKAFESTSATSPHIFDDGKLNYNLGSVTKTLTEPKLRVSPKPFSVEKYSVPFSPVGITQQTLAVPRPKSAILSGKLAGVEEVSFGQTEANRAPTGAASSLLFSPAPPSSLGSGGIGSIGAGDSQDDESMPNLPSIPKFSNVAGSPSNAVLNLEMMTVEETDSSRMKPTTFVILETSQVLKSKKSGDDDQKAGKWTSSNQEMQVTPEPLTLPKSSLPLKKVSPNAIQGIETSNPTLISLDHLGKLDQTIEEDKGKATKEKDIVESPLSHRAHVRKSRPLSTWLSGTTNDHNSEITVKQDESTSAPEKPWLKKPRPLSMNLTARFEPARASFYKINNCVPEESKENVPVMQVSGALFSGTEHKTPGQSEETAAEREQSRSPASPDDHEDKGGGYSYVNEKFSCISKMDISKKAVKALTLTDNKEAVCSLESKAQWQSDYGDDKATAGPKDEEKEESTFSTSSKTNKEKLKDDQEQHKNLTNRELDKISSNPEPTSNDENSFLDSDDRTCKGSRTPFSSGIIRRRISLLLDSASNSTVKTESAQTTVEKEKMSIRVKQQIQSFTSENKEQILSLQRRLFQPRPLSSDITKLFESRAVGNEGRFEKQVDMNVFSSPERSVLQSTPEQRGRESPSKRNDERDLAEKDQSHLMETDTEFSWSRRKSLKKVSKGLEKGIADEKSSSEKISRRNSFVRMRETKGQISTTNAADGVSSMSETISQSSDGIKSDSERLDSDTKSLKMFIIEKEMQHLQEPESVKTDSSSNSLNSFFDKERRPGKASGSRSKSYTAMKTTVDIVHSEQEVKKTKSLQLEANSLEGKEKACFEKEKQSDPGCSSSKITEQNVSSFLLYTSNDKIDTLQEVSEKVVSSSLPATSEDKVEKQNVRKSYIVADQTKPEEKVSNFRRRWNRPRPADVSSLSELPSSAPHSEIKGAEVPKAVAIQQSHEKMANSAMLETGIIGKKLLRVTRHSSFSNPDTATSKSSSRYFERTYDVSATREMLPSTGLKLPENRDDTEAGKETKRWFQDDTTLEICRKAIPRARRNEKSNNFSTGANSAADQVTDFSIEATYQKHVSASRKSESFFEEFSKGYPKISTPEKQKSTLLSEEFLCSPQTSGTDNVSEEPLVTLPVRRSKTADIEKSKKTRGSLPRKSLSVLDIDVLMLEYRKENSEIKVDEESKSFCYHDKKDSHHSKTLQEDYEEHRTPKLTKFTDQDLGMSSPSGRRKVTSDKHNKKGLHHNILDLDALMADYSKETSRPMDLLQKRSGSKLTSGRSLSTKTENTSSPFSEGVKTSWRNDQNKKHRDAELKRDVHDDMYTDLKRSLTEKKKSRPYSAYCEYEEVRKNVSSTHQKSECEGSKEMDGDTSTIASIIRRHKHEKRKSQPSPASPGYSDLQQADLLVGGQMTDAGRDKWKSRKDDQWEPVPSRKKDWSDEASFVISAAMDSSNQTLEGHYLRSKASFLDDMDSSWSPVYGSSHVLEKEKYLEMSVDDEQHLTVESRTKHRGEHPGQSSPRISRGHPKEPHRSVSEVKKSRPIEVHKETQKAFDGLMINLQGTSADYKRYEGRRSNSPDRVQHRGLEISKRRLPSTVEDKMDSQPVQKEPSLEFRKSTKQKIGDMLNLAVKGKKQNEEKTHSGRELQRGKCPVHKAVRAGFHNEDRVKQCFVAPNIKTKDTDALVQERDQFCTCDDKEKYGTYEERGYSTSGDTEPSSKYNEPKDYEDTICRPVSPCKDRTADPFGYPRSTSLSSEVTPASEQPSSLQEPRSISRGELDFTDDTDSSQSIGLVTQDDQAPQGFSFLEPVTTLDSCAQKSRIQLGRKTFRRAPTKHRKGGWEDQIDGTDQFSERNMDPCMYRDSTEPRPLEQEELTTEDDKDCEKPQVLPCQKVAMFPGMDPAVLKASLRRSRPEVEAPNELISKSSKPHPQQGFRVLPPTTGKGEKPNAAVPSWLQELKSKKRLSQIQPSSED
ncbi:uncharacterized protein LOC132404048 isoform X2 [Hypanus sabinus]|uniref:uncharacterized protein LOC132404048 isoform X2 n=1 Tax=Hypanus sabinus TaxID=79690 RepID=UPI0028C42D92|nr:uncharacterized protein LOC132404048 isoform X2 [Hypanus sabinus]